MYVVFITQYSDVTSGHGLSTVWIPLIKPVTRNFLSCKPEQNVQQAVDLPVIWEAISIMWCHCVRQYWSYRCRGSHSFGPLRDQLNRKWSKYILYLILTPHHWNGSQTKAFVNTLWSTLHERFTQYVHVLLNVLIKDCTAGVNVHIIFEVRDIYLHYIGFWRIGPGTLRQS